MNSHQYSTYPSLSVNLEVIWKSQGAPAYIYRPQRFLLELVASHVYTIILGQGLFQTTSFYCADNDIWKVLWKVLWKMFRNRSYENWGSWIALLFSLVGLCFSQKSKDSQVRS